MIKPRFFAYFIFMSVILASVVYAQNTAVPAVLSGAACAVVSIAGFDGSNLVYCAVLAGIIYFIVPITFAFLILIFELLVRFDAAYSLTGAVNSLVSIFARKSDGDISILPSSGGRKLTPDTQAALFKLESPLNMFLNINRAFLYIGFFISLMILYPFSAYFSFPPLVYTTLFNMMTETITVLEPAFLLTLLIILVPLDKIIDIAADLVKLIKS